jgi:spore coat-associated protein N
MKTKSQNRRKFIAAGAILATLIVLASALLVGSGAIFTAKTANPENVFTAGALSMSNSKDNAAILSMDLMKPGDVVTGDVTIKNTGTIRGEFSLAMAVIADLAATNPGAGHLLDVLQLTISAEDGGNVYQGLLKDCGKDKIAGMFEPGEEHTLTFTVTFPDGGEPADNNSGDNIYQGSSATVEFDFSAVQS